MQVASGDHGMPDHNQSRRRLPGVISPIYTPKSNNHSNVAPGRCFSSLPLKIPATTSPDPVPQGSYLCRYPHQSLSCLLPPSLPINHVLSVFFSFVLLLFLFSPSLFFLWFLTLICFSSSFETQLSFSTPFVSPHPSLPLPLLDCPRVGLKHRLWKAISSESLSKLYFPSWKESQK